MSPEEAEQLKNKLRRYNHTFDADVDKYDPPPKYIKSGALAKHQPWAPKMSKDYWQAQCSYRGLRTTGKVDDLKARIRARIRTKDIDIKRELDQMQQLLDAYNEQKAKEELDLWWADPSVRFEKKVASDAKRALTDLLERDPAIRSSCLVVQTRSTALEHWAKQFELGCQIVEPPASMRRDAFESWGAWTIIGKAGLVQQEVKKLSKQAAIEEKAAKTEAIRIEKQRKLEERDKQTALLDEAKSMDDWDLTGSWKVQCQELAEYSSGPRAKLSMKVYRDDFRLDNVRSEDSRLVKDLPHIPRYCAIFRFGIVEGVMRIYPPAAARAKKTFKVKGQSKFEYVWRGREAGEGQIDTSADRSEFKLIFGNHGTSFRGTFQCSYLGAVDIVGSKTEHGNEMEYSSGSKWQQYSKRAYEEERVNRWR